MCKQCRMKAIPQIAKAGFEWADYHADYIEQIEYDLNKAKSEVERLQKELDEATRNERPAS